MPGQQVFILRPSFCRNSRRERTSLKKFCLSGLARACAAFFSPPCRRTVRRQSAPASEKTLHSKLRFFGKPGLASSKRRRKFSVKTRQEGTASDTCPASSGNGWRRLPSISGRALRRNAWTQDDRMPPRSKTHRALQNRFLSVASTQCFCANTACLTTNKKKSRDTRSQLRNGRGDWI